MCLYGCVWGIYVWVGCLYVKTCIPVSDIDLYDICLCSYLCSVCFFSFFYMENLQFLLLHFCTPVSFQVPSGSWVFTFRETGLGWDTGSPRTIPGWAVTPTRSPASHTSQGVCTRRSTRDTGAVGPGRG